MYNCTVERNIFLHCLHFWGISTYLPVVKLGHFLTRIVEKNWAAVAPQICISNVWPWSQYGRCQDDRYSEYQKSVKKWSWRIELCQKPTWQRFRDKKTRGETGVFPPQMANKLGTHLRLAVVILFTPLFFSRPKICFWVCWKVNNATK